MTNYASILVDNTQQIYTQTRVDAGKERFSVQGWSIIYIRNEKDEGEGALKKMCGGRKRNNTAVERKKKEIKGEKKVITGALAVERQLACKTRRALLVSTKYVQ